MKWAGRAIGFASAASIILQRYNNEINTEQFLLEEVSNAYSTFGGIYGAAWGVGWELGRLFTSTDTYQEFKFNFYYDMWESKVGAPNESNEQLWIYFYNNYTP